MQKQTRTALIVGSVIALVTLIGITIWLLVKRSQNDGSSGSLETLSAANGNAVTQLQAQIIGGYIYVFAAVTDSNGNTISQPVWWLVDSGASQCTLDSGFAAQNGIRATSHAKISAGQSTQVGVADGIGFAVATAANGSIQVSPQKVWIVSETDVINAEPQVKQFIEQNGGFGGSLGLPFLREWNLLVDYQGNTVSATQQDLARLLPGRPIVPVSIRNGSVLADVWIGAAGGYGDGTSWLPTQPATWIVDTGSNQTIVAIAAAQDMESRAPGAIQSGPPYQTAQLVGGSVTLATAHVALAIGSSRSAQPASQRQLSVSIPQSVIAGIQGHGGDLASDYFNALGQVGFGFRQSKIVL
jgi:hypothetical protein